MMAYEEWSFVLRQLMRPLKISYHIFRLVGAEKQQRRGCEINNLAATALLLLCTLLL